LKNKDEILEQLKTDYRKGDFTKPTLREEIIKILEKYADRKSKDFNPTKMVNTIFYANQILSLLQKHDKELCDHDFRYSHIESPPSGAYSHIPPNREVVVCRKCGEIIKTIAN